MIVFFTAAALIIIYSISAFGWGRLVTTCIFPRPIKSAAFEISVGLAVWVFIGGMLNALGLAYSLTLDIIFILGVFFFGIVAFGPLKLRTSAQGDSFKSPGFFQDKIQISKILIESLPGLLIISAASFFIVTLLPANAFNHHDDLYTYLPQLFRMLQTGRLGDALSFDFLGYHSFGAHSFLQSFILNHFSFKFVNGFDAVYCFLLGGLLLNDIGRRVEAHWLFRITATAVYIVINPQYVNISALYSGSLVILALIYSSFLLHDSFEKADTREMFGSAVIFAFIGSTLVALKHTFAPYAVAYSIIFFLLLFLFSSLRRKTALFAGFTAVMTGIMLVPWVWPVSGKIALFLNSMMGRANSLYRNATLNGVLPPAQPNKSTSAIINLFSSEKLFYGDHVSDYSFVVLCVLAAALWAGYLLIKKKESANRGNLIIVASVGISTSIVFLAGVHFTRFDAGIRYACPIVIAAFSSMILLFAERSGAQQAGSTGQMTGIRQGAVLLASGICIGFFLTGWYGRLNLVTQYRTMLSYPISENYIVYNEKMLSIEEQETVIAMQKEAVKDLQIFAWFETPFFLDFKRNKISAIPNPILLLKKSGLSVSDLADGELLGNYLRSAGIRYVIWGYAGTPKQIASGTAELEKGLLALSKKSHLLYNDGRKALFDIND